jgi:hypothetical protein
MLLSRFLDGLLLLQVSKAGKSKSKSAHDLAKDPTLAADIGTVQKVSERKVSNSMCLHEVK